MKTIIKTLLSLLSLTFMLYACKKNTHNNTDTVKPILTFVEPTVNDTVNLTLEHEVHIEFTATDETSLHELQVIIIKNGVDTIFTQTPEVHDLKVYSYHTHLIPTGIVGLAAFQAVIKAEDHGGNITTEIINFYVKP
jgi:hypothetical protein